MVEAALQLLVLAPSTDAMLTSRVLQPAATRCILCATPRELLEKLDDDIGALLIAEESLTEPFVKELSARLVEEPAWSDLPILVVAQAEHHAGLIGALAPLGNVSLLRRPMSPDAFVSAVAAAFRARRRQFQVRDLIEQQREQGRRKDEFLAMLAHELRNPLAPVRYAAQILRAEGIPPERIREIGALLERQIGHMSHLIDDLLDTTRVIRGMVSIEREAVDLSKLAREAVASHGEAARRARITLESHVEDGLVVDGDATRLRQVLDNLIENALKFSHEGAAVTVSIARREGHAVIVVRDEGEGIDSRLMPHIFEPFVQAGQGIDRQRGGLGLGLALARNLIRLHGGEITAESDGPGHGATFTVHLPLGESDSPPVRHGAEQEPGARPLRIVIAEDNVDSAETLQLLLELSGHEVSVVHTGLAAVEETRRVRPDVLICDIGLPGLTGYEVARALRRDPALAGTRFIALTGYGGGDDRDKALGAGFDMHLTKPVEPAVLIRELAKVETHRAAA